MKRQWATRFGGSEPIVQPLTPAQMLAIAVQHHRAGRTTAAQELCLRILGEHPDHAESLHLLGVLAHRAKRPEQAIRFLERAATLRPDDPAVLLNFGAALLADHRADAALQPLQRASTLAPGSPEAFLQFGAALLAAGHLAEAAETLARAVELQPGNAEAWNNLGVTQFRRGEFLAALEAFERTVALRPDAANGWKNLGMVLVQLPRADDALRAFETAARLDPGDADTQNKLAVTHEHARRWQQAVEHYDRAILLAPHDPAPQWNLARLLLLSGDFSRAWPLFESRLRLKYLKLGREFARPQWRGEPVAGRTILLWTEGGFGDALQFIRFAPLIAARGATVLLECQPELATLLATVPGISRVFRRGEPLPAFDLQCPLQSLMLAFGTTEQTIPRTVPYLHAESHRVQNMRGRLGEHRTLHVGLAWAGSQNPQDVRSRTLATFAPLAGVQGVTFYRLQQGGEANEPPPSSLVLHDAVESSFDFADTAAVMENLDLIITVDTSLGHLAGGLGRPVWVLLPLHPDFRWMLDRPDTPWYPTMRLFRQTQRGSWTEPVLEMQQSLRERVGRP